MRAPGKVDLRPGEAGALSALGLARRAGRAAVGTRAVREAAAAGRLELLVLARDAGGNARGRLGRSLTEAGAPVLECGTRAALGAALGRGPTVAVGVTDPGLASRIVRALEEKDTGPGPRVAVASQHRESSEQEER